MKNLDWSSACNTYGVHCMQNRNRLNKDYLNPLRLWYENCPSFTFFEDMAACYLNNLDELKKYVNRMLSRFGKIPFAYATMIDSLNLLGWIVYDKDGDCELSRYLFDTFKKLMNNKKVYSHYVDEETMGGIRYLLD